MGIKLPSLPVNSINLPESPEYLEPATNLSNSNDEDPDWIDMSDQGSQITSTRTEIAEEFEGNSGSILRPASGNSFSRATEEISTGRTPKGSIPQGHDAPSEPHSRGMNPYRAGVGEPSDIHNSERGKPSQGRHAQAEIRRVWVYMDGNEPTEEGQEAQRDRLELERSSIDFVLSQERLAGRFPQRFDGNNKGFDILSDEQSGGTRSSRYIEVKATRGEWGARGVSMTHAQMLFALRRGNAFWLYVVERADSQNPILHRIQNPVLYSAGFRFNDSWRDFADMTRKGEYIDDPDQLALADCGRRFRHDVLGSGWITFVEESDDGLLAQLWYAQNETPERELVKWDSKVMHKLD
jgi:hypothetical protein